jgi:hypothetical protein
MLIVPKNGSWGIVPSHCESASGGRSSLMYRKNETASLAAVRVTMLARSDGSPFYVNRSWGFGAPKDQGYTIRKANQYYPSATSQTPGSPGAKYNEVDN